MAKKTKKKNKRGARSKIFGEVATTLVSVLAAAIVESLIERLLQQNLSHNIDDKQDSDRHQNHTILESRDGDRPNAENRNHSNHNPIKNIVSKLVDNVGNVKLTRKELLEAVSSFAKEPTFNLNDVGHILKDATKRTIQSSINPVGNDAELIFEGVTDTLRNVTNTIDLNDTDRSLKKDKKKNKKKKKKKSQ